MHARLFWVHTNQGKRGMPGGFLGPLGDPYGNIAMIGGSYQHDFGTSGRIPMAILSPELEHSYRDESPGRMVGM